MRVLLDHFFGVRLKIIYLHTIIINITHQVIKYRCLKTHNYPFHITSCTESLGRSPQVSNVSIYPDQTLLALLWRFICKSTAFAFAHLARPFKVLVCHPQPMTVCLSETITACQFKLVETIPRVCTRRVLVRFTDKTSTTPGPITWQSFRLNVL